MGIKSCAKKTILCIKTLYKSIISNYNNTSKYSRRDYEKNCLHKMS